MIFRIAAYYTITYIRLIAIIAIHRDETVVTRFARHFVIGSALVLPMVIFAYFDHRGILTFSSLYNFRFLHPFLLEPFFLGILVGL